MRIVLTVCVVLLLVLAGCTTQTGGTASPETTEVPTTTSNPTPTTTPEELKCLNGNPPADVNPEHLLPRSGDGWTRLEKTGYSVHFIEGYEKHAYAQYEGPSGAAYDVSVTRWTSAEEAADAFNETMYVAAVSGNVGVVVSGPDPEVAEELLLRVSCIESGDVVEESTFSMETMTPRDKETNTTSTESG